MSTDKSLECDEYLESDPRSIILIGPDDIPLVGNDLDSEAERDALGEELKSLLKESSCWEPWVRCCKSFFFLYAAVQIVALNAFGDIRLNHDDDFHLGVPMDVFGVGCILVFSGEIIMLLTACRCMEIHVKSILWYKCLRLGIMIDFRNTKLKGFGNIGLKFSTKLSEIKKQCTVLNSSDRFEELCEELQELQDKNKICLTQMHTSTQFDSEEVEDKIRGRRVMFRKDGRIKVKTFDVHFNLNSILFCKYNAILVTESQTLWADPTMNEYFRCTEEDVIQLGVLHKLGLSKIGCHFWVLYLLSGIVFLGSVVRTLPP